MKRGIFINLAVIFLLLFFAFLPVLGVAALDRVADSRGCNINIPTSEGPCGDLYTQAFGIALLGTFTLPLILGVLVLYLFGVVVFFFFSLRNSRKKGQPVAPLAAGMMGSTGGVVGLASLATVIVLVVNWYQGSYISACESLPAPLAVSGVHNGLLAAGAKLPYPEGRPEQFVIQVFTAQGEEEALLKPLPASSGPAYSPDGQTIVFSAKSNASGLWGLYLLDTQGQVSGPMIEDRLEMEAPAWSPDGQAIIFHRWVEESGTPDTEIYITNRDGSGLRRLPGGKGFDGEARFSPDGSQVVFVSDREGPQQIYRMDSDGTGVRRLTYTKGVDIDPDWSPDGEWIVFSSNRGSQGGKNNYNLYIMAPDGTNQCQLTRGEGSEWEPTWSPDGTWIAYISLLESQVYLVRPDGSEATPLPPLPETIDVLDLDWGSQPGD